MLARWNVHGPAGSGRNHAYLVFDTLYGIDTSWAAQPQMVEGHQVEGWAG